MSFLNYKIIGASKKFKNQLRPLVRPGSVNFCQIFWNLSHETVPLSPYTILSPKEYHIKHMGNTIQYVGRCTQRLWPSFWESGESQTVDGCKTEAWDTFSKYVFRYFQPFCACLDSTFAKYALKWPVKSFTNFQYQKTQNLTLISNLFKKLQ